MSKILHRFFTDDHHRIEDLLNQACLSGGHFDDKYYQQFRGALLRHIKMEEKILFPAARKADEALMNQLIPRYRLEHGALTSLMVLPPSDELVRVIRHLLDRHDQAEEEPGGLYDTCERLTLSQTQELLDQLLVAPEVPIHPPNPAAYAVDAARRALARAGYDYDAIARDRS
ncbi:MAG: hemerythrin domain-containing protein [Bacteroidetes bacterium]|nr:hemerythrin domain-containing protein [Bacteroidota bacterium]MBS1628652.1 hemerythrin domain-containing protein [Bacteroidota bacterium]